MIFATCRGFLHGEGNEAQNILMPVNKKCEFDDFIASCGEYDQKINRQITFEYILIKDLTCTEQAVKSLKKAFLGIICKMKLLGYNSGFEFSCQMLSIQAWRLLGLGCPVSMQRSPIGTSMGHVANCAEPQAVFEKKRRRRTRGILTGAESIPREWGKNRPGILAAPAMRSRGS